MCSPVRMRKLQTKSVVSASKHQFCSLFVAKNSKVFQYSNFEKVVVRLKLSLVCKATASSGDLRCVICNSFSFSSPFLKRSPKLVQYSALYILYFGFSIQLLPAPKIVVHFIFWFINTAAASSCNLRCVTCNFSSFSSTFQTEEAKKVQSPCLYS